jgi:HPt (histidine-containing phosphotransfer) domain-containing protein
MSSSQARVSGVSSETADPPVGPVLDAAALLAACDGSAAFLARICDLLSRMLPVELDRATRALREGKATTLRHVAHQLTGMLAAFSAVGAEVASELEEAAARQDLEAASQHLGRLTPIGHEIVRQVGVVSIEALLRVT